MCAWYKQNGNFTKSLPNGIGLIINILSSVNTVNTLRTIFLGEKKKSLIKNLRNGLNTDVVLVLQNDRSMFIYFFC